MNPQILIDAVVHRTVVFIAQLATAGGVRAPLAHVANEIFLGLTSELLNQGVKKKVIADMFGMALRTYHRRVRELARSHTDVGHTLWEAVLGFLKTHEPVSVAEVHRRFRQDDREVVTGVLHDLVESGLAYRAGRGDAAMMRLADEADFSQGDAKRSEAYRYLVALTVYRHGPVSSSDVARLTCLSEPACQAALQALLEARQICEVRRGADARYSADHFEVPLGTEQGWEAAVLDHYQAMVSAIARKLNLGAASAQAQDVVGGSTWSLDVWEGHPLAEEARSTLAQVRDQVEALRGRIDEYNADHGRSAPAERVVFYMGQYVDTEESDDGQQVEEHGTDDPA